MEDIVVTNNRDHLLLYFSVKNCFTDDLVRAVQSGIRTRFTFFVKLYEIKDFSRDKKIADLRVNHEVSYDTLKKVYTVSLSERPDGLITVDNLEQAEQLMAQIMGLKITELQNLHKGRRYQIQMMAELDKIRLPFRLHYVLFFLSLWDFKTDWYTVRFRY